MNRKRKKKFVLLKENSSDVNSRHFIYFPFSSVFLFTFFKLQSVSTQSIGDLKLSSVCKKMSSTVQKAEIAAKERRKKNGRRRQVANLKVVSAFDKSENCVEQMQCRPPPYNTNASKPELTTESHQIFLVNRVENLLVTAVRSIFFWKRFKNAPLFTT